MQIIKYILLTLIFLASVAIGRLTSKKYINRVNELKNMKNALNIFKTKIKFTYEPIGQVFEEISQNMNNNIGNIFKDAKNKMKTQTAQIAWEKAIEENKNNLKEEDKQAIKTLSKLLRTNRHGRSNKPNRNNTKIHRKADRTSRKGKRKKRKVIQKTHSNPRTNSYYYFGISQKGT